MEIIRIFGDSLFSFHLDGEQQNELAGLLSKRKSWKNVGISFNLMVYGMSIHFLNL